MFPHKYLPELSNAHEAFNRLSTADRAKIMIKFDQEFSRLKKMVQEHTGWPKDKVLFWFKEKNPHLGNVSPAFMIAMGRFEKLEQFIEACKDGHV